MLAAGVHTGRVAAKRPKLQKEEASVAEEHGRFWLIFLLVALGFVAGVGLWLFATVLVDLPRLTHVSPLQIRGNAEAVAALFGALAFGGVIASLLYQRKELALQREELTLQRKELHDSVVAQQRSSEALHASLDLESRLLQTRIVLDLDREFRAVTVSALDENRHWNEITLDFFLRACFEDETGVLFEKGELAMGGRFILIKEKVFEDLLDRLELLEQHRKANLLDPTCFRLLFLSRLKWAAYYLDEVRHPINQLSARLTCRVDELLDEFLLVFTAEAEL